MKKRNKLESEIVAFTQDLSYTICHSRTEDIDWKIVIEDLVNFSKLINKLR